jgi:hypothetical protein
VTGRLRSVDARALYVNRSSCHLGSLAPSRAGETGNQPILCSVAPLDRIEPNVKLRNKDLIAPHLKGDA